MAITIKLTNTKTVTVHLPSFERIPSIVRRALVGLMLLAILLLLFYLGRVVVGRIIFPVPSIATNAKTQATVNVKTFNKIRDFDQEKRARLPAATFPDPFGSGDQITVQ